MDRRKQLKALFKQEKPEMGVYAIECKASGKMLIAASQNLKSAMNSSRFKLNAGMHPCRELQEEWQERGAEGFAFRVLDTLAYAEDKTQTDYTEDLEALRTLWMERLAEQNIEFYRS